MSYVGDESNAQEKNLTPSVQPKQAETDDNVVPQQSQVHVRVLLITARIRRMGEGNIFSLCVSSHLDGGGGGVEPLPRSRLGGRGYPLPRSRWGYHLPRPGGGGTPTGIACTYYAAGDMPLAFTQEDFLVF